MEPSRWLCSCSMFVYRWGTISRSSFFGRIPHLYTRPSSSCKCTWISQSTQWAGCGGVLCSRKGVIPIQWELVVGKNCNRCNLWCVWGSCSGKVFKTPETRYIWKQLELAYLWAASWILAFGTELCESCVNIWRWCALGFVQHHQQQWKYVSHLTTKPTLHSN